VRLAVLVDSLQLDAHAAPLTRRRPAAWPRADRLACRGFPDFESYAWWGTFTAGRTPRDIVDRFSNALAETLREPAIKNLIEAMEITLQIGSPDVQRKFLADQMKLWGPVVKEHNIRTDI